MSQELKQILTSAPFSDLIEVRGDLSGLFVGPLSLTDDSRRCGPNAIFSVTEQGLPFTDAALRKECRVLLVHKDHLTEIVPLLSGHHDPALLVTEDIHLAQGLLASAIHGNPSDSLYLVGVTGTNGKTSIVSMLYHIWSSSGLRPGMIGTLGVKYLNGSGDTAEYATGYTTPRAGELHEIFAKMRAEGVTHVAMEVSSEGISMGRIGGCRFDASVFTNLTPEHLDFHRAMEEYFSSKMVLFHQTPGRIIIFSGSDYGKKALEYAEAIAPGRVIALEHPFITALPSPTMFNCINGSLAVLASSPEPQFQRGAAVHLQTMPEIPGRFNVVPFMDSNRFGVVDYAHTPDALETVLSEVRQMGIENLCVVFGCGGDRDREKRALMGRVAGRLADRIIVTDDNPRTEEPAAIRAQILSGIADRSGCIEMSDRANAIREGARWLSEQGGRSALVVAGKGHESVQIFRDHREPFSDIEELRGAFTRIKERTVVS
jgi:UDP-N-acetylmuramoyl-L-alanyl-D-glutamate--2,6-diaminopimelate ligase